MKKALTTALLYSHSVIVKVKVFVIVFVIVALSSCEYKELCYDHSHDKECTAILELKLKLESDVESTITPPEYMKVCFYSPETQVLQNTEFVGPYGGPLHTAPGIYDMLVYSFGTEYVQIDGESNVNTIEAFTSDITSTKGKALASFTKGVNYEAPGPIIYPPDHLLVAHKTVEIPSYSDQAVTISASAATIVETYYFEVPHVKGAQYIESVEAFVTNQALSSFFGRGEVNSSPATLYFPVEVYPAQGLLKTSFNTFGKLPGDSRSYVHILVRDTGGTEYHFSTDITGQFEKSDHEIVVDEDIDIPQPQDGGSGIAPTVDQWDEENYEVPIG